MSIQPTTTINRRVRQVADLVHLLSEQEVVELIELAPRLRYAVRKEKADEKSDLLRWVREEMAQYAIETQPMQPGDQFLSGLTVAEYFALPDHERERIWDKLYRSSILSIWPRFRYEAENRRKREHGRQIHPTRNRTQVAGSLGERPALSLTD